MKFANVNGRLHLLESNGGAALRGADVADRSGGALPSSPLLAFTQWDEVVTWAQGYDGPFDHEVSTEQLGPPSPAPAQIFAIGVNYADHLAEAGWDQPEVPMVFPKMLPSIAAPFGVVELSAEDVDWEVEVVAVIGRHARKVRAEDAWSYVAGLTAGQDFSARRIQMRPEQQPQFSLGKSLPGFAPIGPVLTTPDEFPDPNDIELSCAVNGERLQHSSTKHLVFSVASLVEYLSHATTLLPGDLIFTGTPSGVGGALSPPRYLKEDDVVETYVAGVGSMRHRCVPERLPEA
jgi:2-keto-4-pentenoate hydratase/2-oxohepta-3-ene-1,7-dioic acid hydratase in catechol pathway